MGKRILVVEDHEVNMELTTDLLEVMGYSVSQAWRAEEGIALAQAETFDLVLMDVSLPGVDGLTATRRLRAIPSYDTTPILALTAHAMRGDEEKAMEAGCSGYITKPINIQTFNETIARYLR